MLAADKRTCTALAALAVSLCVVTATWSQTPAPADIPRGTRDVTQAAAGTYALDPNHTGVIARVVHIGFSYSVFRFDKVRGTLTWDPREPARSSLSVTVQTASITSNVEGFAAQLAGDDFLKSRAFPEATFTSTAFRPTDAASGKVEGNLVLMGKTLPMSFDVALVGAGKAYGGGHVIGVQARGAIDPQDAGLPAAFFDRPIELVIDTEFAKGP
jgi:polyisoprenoid-binding protein YceI